MGSKVTSDVEKTASETKAPEAKEELTDEQLAALAAGRSEMGAEKSTGRRMQK